MTAIYILFLLFFILSISFLIILRLKNMHIWFLNYILNLFKRQKITETKHIMFCFVDHYEPQWRNKDNINIERNRVNRWFNEYPRIASKHQDADGCFPKHTFFYPEEEYRKEHLDKLADLCARGFGDIEVHLHHQNDTSENFRNTLENFTQTLHEKHGAFTVNQKTGKLNYSFIHGNWTLCNSHPNGDWCGVNDELLVLKETGCYADFTFPSAPSITQTSTINSLYYAKDKAGQSKSHNNGIEVEIGKKPSGDLMLIQGPLGINWKQRKKLIIPQIENSDIRKNIPPTKDRIDLWVKTAIHVKGKPDWIFIKVHTHGTQDPDMDTLLGEPFDQMCEYLENNYNDGINYQLHYVTSREMYNIIKAAESNQSGNPNLYRGYILSAPKYKTIPDN